jgi:uncharacterized protein YbaR (Trm112 family)
MVDLYGAEGERIAAAALRGSLSGDLADAPLFEDIVRRARLTVVHSDYARQRVLDRLPDADVRRVPMGVPLPALTFAEDARRALGLPQSAFIIASVTHVNPYKRIPVVLSALRRLVRHIPEALLVIAGSVAPGINLEREIQMLGLKRNVLILGYVTDTQARLLARAADVAVNLRYPSAGETSASLLRLLGAGLPVIVTDDLPSLEFPRSAVLPVPVDRFEDEFLAELLLMLACDTPQRESAGRAARDFVEREHSMSHAVAGYADVIKDAFGVALAPVTPPNLTEASVVVDTQSGANVAELTPTTRTTGDAAWNLSLLGHDATMLALATALGELRLDQFLPENGVPMNSGTSTIRPELLAVLACPVCKASVELVENKLVCTKCKRRYRIDDGIPVMLADEAE